MRSTFRTPLQKHALVKSTYAEDYDYSSAEKEKIRKQNIIKSERFYVVRFSDVEVLVYRKTVQPQFASIYFIFIFFLLNLHDAHVYPHYRQAFIARIWRNVASKCGCRPLPWYARLFSQGVIAFGSSLASCLRVGHCKMSWKPHAILGSNLAGACQFAPFSHRDIIYFKGILPFSSLNPFIPFLLIVTLHNNCNPEKHLQLFAFHILVTSMIFDGEYHAKLSLWDSRVV